MAYNPNNPNGQTNDGGSAPVVIATNQAAVSTPAGVTMLNAASATSVGTALTVTGYPAAVVSITGTFVATVTFEASTDGTTWVSMAGHQIGVNGSLTTTASAPGDYRFATAGYTQLRANMVWTSGTSITVKGYASAKANAPTVVALGAGSNAVGTVGVTSLPALPTGANAIGSVSVTGTTAISAASLPLPTGAALDATLTGGTQQAKITDGTQVANTFAGDSGQNALLIAGGRKDSGSQALSTSNYGGIDVSNYAWVSVQVTAYTSGTLAFKSGNNNSTWVNAALVQPGAVGAVAPIASAAGTGLWHGPLSGRYFMLDGTTSAFVGTVYVSFFTTARQMAETVVVNATASTLQMTATQAGTWTVQPGNTANTTAWLVSEGQAVSTGGYSFSNLATNATTTVKSGAGRLHAITVNTLGTATTATVYDNTAGSGTKIATISTTGQMTTLLYDLAFATGLTIVTAGTTAADLTVVYK